MGLLTRRKPPVRAMAAGAVIYTAGRAAFKRRPGARKQAPEPSLKLSAERGGRTWVSKD